MSEKDIPSQPSRTFTVVSWVVTLGIVISLLGFTFWWIQRSVGASPQPPIVIPTTAPENPQLPSQLPSLKTESSNSSIIRQTQLKTNIPERPRYDVVTYKVGRGDSVFGIAAEYKIKPETVLWANYDALNDDPHALSLGLELNVPPTDGVFYQWEDKDTFESVASKFKAKPDDIINWPGNQIDLTNPRVEVGSWVMIPGGKREFRQWIIPTIARGRSGTASVGNSTCSGGSVGSGALIWPAGNRYLSGNDYWSGHLGIDIAAGMGAPVFSADSGVVTMSQGGWNYGYGNVIMVDHGNGYVTLYAHLSQRNVTTCQSVGAGTVIGLAGNTGNSFGPHLHFEVRLNGGFVNPWFVLPAP